MDALAEGLGVQGGQHCGNGIGGIAGPRGIQRSIGPGRRNPDRLDAGHGRTRIGRRCVLIGRWRTEVDQLLLPCAAAGRLGTSWVRRADGRRNHLDDRIRICRHLGPAPTTTPAGGALVTIGTVVRIIAGSMVLHRNVVQD